MPLVGNQVGAKVRISYKSCHVGRDRWLPWQLPTPVAKEWIEFRVYHIPAGARETTEVWNVSRIFPPVTIQEHNFIMPLQLGKDILTPTADDTNAIGEASLLESLLSEVCMIPVFFNRVHTTFGSCGRSHHRGRVPVTTAHLQHSLRMGQRR